MRTNEILPTVCWETPLSSRQIDVPASDAFEISFSQIDKCNNCQRVSTPSGIKDTRMAWKWSKTFSAPTYIDIIPVYDGYQVCY